MHARSPNQSIPKIGRNCAKSTNHIVDAHCCIVDSLDALLITTINEDIKLDYIVFKLDI